MSPDRNIGIDIDSALGFAYPVVDANAQKYYNRRYCTNLDG